MAEIARLRRVHLAGVPEHIVQRGNNRHVCFVDDEDFAVYSNWLKQYADTFQVGIHAWVFMTNHVHLLCTASDDHGVCLMMQSLGRQYVGYFNRRYRRTGTLWEGRFKSALVQEEPYIMSVYRYIELNPVRAGMVTSPSDYSWSSHAINAYGVHSDLCQTHPCFLTLAKTENERQEAYRALFRVEIDELLHSEIRRSLNKGLALGNDKFKAEIEALSGRRQHEEHRGRPAGKKKLN